MMDALDAHGLAKLHFCCVICAGADPVITKGTDPVATISAPLESPRPTIGKSTVSTYDGGHACGRKGSQNQISFPIKPAIIPFCITLRPWRFSGGGNQDVLASCDARATTLFAIVST